VHHTVPGQVLVGVIGAIGEALLFGSEAVTSKILFPPFSPRLRTLRIVGIPGRPIIIIEPCAYIHRADGIGQVGSCK